MVNEYEIINSSEVVAQTVRGKTTYIRRDHSPEVAAGAWETIASWEPPDDLQMALYPDRTAYDKAVDGPIMDDEPHIVLVEKKKRSAVSVSYLSNL